MNSFEQRKNDFLAREYRRLQKNGLKPLANCLGDGVMSIQGKEIFIYRHRRNYLLWSLFLTLVLTSMLLRNFHAKTPGIILVGMVAFCCIVGWVLYADRSPQFVLTTTGLSLHKPDQFIEWEHLLDVYVHWRSGHATDHLVLLLYDVQKDEFVRRVLSTNMLNVTHAHIYRYIWYFWKA